MDSSFESMATKLSTSITRSRLECANGFSVSAQANEFTYCCPRDNQGPYESVELGYPSHAVSLWTSWAEDDLDLTQTIYGRVPVGAVAYVIAQNSGRNSLQSSWATKAC